MMKQTNLFGELVMELGSVLDDKALEYSQEHYTPEINKNDLADAFKAGELEVLGEVIDIIKKFTTIYEA